MALTKDRNTHRREGDFLVLGVAANTKIFAGALVAVNAAGYAVPGSASTTLRAAGRADGQVDNTGGANGAKTVVVRQGVFKFQNSSGGDAITAAHVLANCFIVDDATVAATDGSGARSWAGRVLGVDSDGVWVEVGIFAPREPCEIPEIPEVPIVDAVAEIEAADAAAAVGSEPTKAEFDAVVELANETKAVVNGLLAALTAAGLMAAVEE